MENFRLIRIQFLCNFFYYQRRRQIDCIFFLIICEIL